MTYGVVWFKRDLHLADHAALAAAARQGPVLCLYIVEPSLWAQPPPANRSAGYKSVLLLGVRYS